jgi:hypothetical protein
LYLKVVPICLKNMFYEKLAKDFPIILLDKWEDLDETKLKYEDYDFSKTDKLSASYYISLINNYFKEL